MGREGFPRPEERRGTQEAGAAMVVVDVAGLQGTWRREEGRNDADDGGDGGG